MATMYDGIVNSPATTLSSDITVDAVTIPLTDASVLPAGPNLATIGTGEDAETVLYTEKSGNSLTGVTRGFDVSGGIGVAKLWPSGTEVARRFTNYDYNTLKTRIENLGIYNVKDYGAKGDWTGTTGTDDTTAIQAALTACCDAGGGIVYVPLGRYKITQALTVGAGVTLQGAGRTGTIIDNKGASGVSAISVSGAHYAIKDIQITGGIGASWAIYVNNANCGRFENIYMAWVSNGMKFNSNSWLQTVIDCRVHDCGTGTAYYVGDATNGIKFIRCEVNTAGIGFDIANPHSASIDTPTVEACSEYGIYIEEGDNISVRDGYFENAKIRIGKDTASSTVVRGCVIENNFFIAVDLLANNNIGKVAIYSSYAAQVKITNNTFWWVNSDTGTCIQFETGVGKTLVQLNRYTLTSKVVDNSGGSNVVIGHDGI